VNNFMVLVKLHRKSIHEFFIPIYMPAIKLWLLKLWPKVVDAQKPREANRNLKSCMALSILCLMFKPCVPWLTERTWCSGDSPQRS